MGYVSVVLGLLLLLLVVGGGNGQYQHLRSFFSSSAFSRHVSPFSGTFLKKDYLYPELSCPQNPQPISPIPSQAQAKVDAAFAVIEQKFQDLMNQFKFVPGVSAAVVLDQEVIWAKGFGSRDLQNGPPPSPTDTLFRIGSISKLFVDLALLQLRDKGLVDLDEEISVKFPELQITNPFPTKRGITYRQLGSHMAAMPRSSPCQALWGNCNTTDDEMFKRLAQESLIQPLDAMPAYSNLGLALLGHLVGRIAGMKYEDYVQQNILNPLGMSNTGFRYTTQVQQKMAVGAFFGSKSPAPLYDLGWEGPAGQMYSSPTDLCKLMSLLFRDNLSVNSIPSQILDGQTIKEWLLPHYVTSFIPSNVIVGIEMPWETYLLTREDLPSLNRYWVKGKDGAVIGYTAQLLVVPDMKLGVAVLLNGGLNGPAADFAVTIVDELVPVLDGIFKQYQPSPPLPPNPKIYIGNFTVTRTPDFPSWLLGVTANITLVEDSNGHTRLHLRYTADVAGLTTLQYTLYMNWIPQANGFQLQDLDPSCPGTLGGGNQYVFFLNGPNTFILPGLWYGFVWHRDNS